MPGNAELVNFGNVKINIERSLRHGLELALQDAMRYAKEQAPVRDVFLHGRGRAESPALRSERMNLSETGKVIRKGLAEQQEFLKNVKRQQFPRRTFQMIQTHPVHAAEVTGEKRVIASARSANPVVSVTRWDELRHKDTSEPRQGKLRNVTNFSLVGGEIVLPLRNKRGTSRLLEEGTLGGEDREPAIVFGSADPELSYKGRKELKRQADILKKAERGIRGTGTVSGPFSSRANAPFFRSSRGTDEFGGRLRDEIFVTSIRNTGTTISGWVVSPTPYAKYQEYGTSRHVAQPYMRPALYKSREWLMQRVRSSLVKGRVG